MSPEKIAELRKLRGCGLTSAVGEYTPDELWDALDEIERLQAAMSRQIDYEQLIADCFARTKQQQGTLGCSQFARGAEWWREQVLKAERLS